jgi:hypothetical protein
MTKTGITGTDITFNYLFQDLLLKGVAFPRKKGKHIYSCNLCSCNRRFTELSLKWHKIREHDHRDCKQCRQLFVDAAALKEHPCPMKSFSCDLCPGMHFRSHIGWIKHHRKAALRSRFKFC